MEGNTNYLEITIGAVLVYNFVLSRFMGVCPFLGVSKRLDTALGMGGAVIFVMAIASFATSLVYQYLTTEIEFLGHHLNLVFLKITLFILIIAALVQIVEVILQKLSPPLYKALGIYLPLITTNCAVLGVALLVIQKEYNLLESVVYGFGTAVGFGFALVIMAGIREQLELASVPKGMKGNPITLVTAGILALAFMGFANLV